MAEQTEQFEARKRDHIDQALSDRNQALGDAGFSELKLVHEALPDANFSDIRLDTTVLGEGSKTPFLVSSMTAGHVGSVDLNIRLAKACQQRGWLFAVGSQRRELSDPSAADEWKKLRDQLPGIKLIGNIGITQLAEISTSDVQNLVSHLDARAMIVHLNPLQEVIQEEGTPDFKNAFRSLAELTESLGVPVIVKETGCGMSERSLYRLKSLQLGAVDVAGFGGTHWGLIEGSRSHESSFRRRVSESFASWGISTVESLENAQSAEMNCEVWASGGVRSGLDAAKAIALGASVVGFAKPILEAALSGEEALLLKMEQLEFELRTAIFCSGLESVSELHNNEEVLQWVNL